MVYFRNIKSIASTGLILLMTGLFIKLEYAQGLSDMSFMAGAFFLVIGLFQITYDLEFYDRAIQGTKKLVAVIRNDYEANPQEGNFDLSDRKQRFEHKKLYCLAGLFLWCLSALLVNFI